MPRALASLLMTLALALQPAAAPSTRPAETAAWPSAAFVGRLVANLGDADAEVRGAARRALLGLTVDDLPLLEQALRDRPPAAESTPVSLVVRETLANAYLRRAKRAYHHLEDTGEVGGGGEGRAVRAFLGIGLPPSWEDFDPYGRDGSDALGVTVLRTLPGFNAYEALAAGDVLVGIEAGGQSYPLAGRQSLLGVLGSLRPGDAVTFRVVRGGALLRVPFRLDRAIETQTDPDWQPLAAGAAREAAQAWQTTFAPLLEPQTATAAAPATRPTDG